MITRRLVLVYLALSVASLGIFVVFSATYFRPGFPLDDAWIHQTYARNLVETGRWTFQQGTPSTGSTAPLWTLLLAAGHLLGIAPVAWNLILGCLTLTALALTVSSGLNYFAPQRPKWALLAGSLVIFEWHLAWAAGSGMETLLFSLAAVFLLVGLLRKNLVPYQLGLLVGLAVWIRPDGITLAGPVFFVLLLGRRDWRGSLHAFLGMLLLLLPYAAFNLALSGEWLPSTFFAKQAEYAVLRDLPLGDRLLAQLTVPLVGVGLAAVPGLIFGGWKAVRDRRWAELAGLAWVFGTAIMYALRLPVTYQHGRYLIPVIPAWLILGIGPLLSVARPGDARFFPRVISRAWVLLLPVITLAFFVTGVRVYGQDIAVIESEMVAAGVWVSENLPDEPQLLIAAHDIGALGYYGGKPILDLAGLVSAEVIPIMRDEAALRRYLDDRAVDYLVTLEGWYPELEENLYIVYRTGGEYSPALGGTNMVVYRWGRR